MIIAIPEHVILKDTIAVYDKIMFITAIFTIIAALLGYLLVRRNIVKPLHFISKQIEENAIDKEIKTKENAEYEGTANKVVYKPLKKEYYFYENVILKQINEKKEIEGDEVILNTVDGKAYAKGLAKKPVIMIFDIAEEKE